MRYTIWSALAVFGGFGIFFIGMCILAYAPETKAYLWSGIGLIYSGVAIMLFGPYWQPMRPTRW